MSGTPRVLMRRGDGEIRYQLDFCRCFGDFGIQARYRAGELRRWACSAADFEHGIFVFLNTHFHFSRAFRECLTAWFRVLIQRSGHAMV